MKEFLVIGQIGKTHGIKGEVKVYSLTDNVERFKDLDKVFIEDKEYNIEGCKLQGDRAILKFQGIDTIEEATKYRNQNLRVRREDAVALPEGSYYVADLIGSKVYDEEETYIGEIYDVIETGSNDVYWVKNNDTEVLIPAIANVVVSIDITISKVTIKPLRVWM